MKPNKHYDIFISYRREGGAEMAYLIMQHLKHKGYSVFYDHEGLREGKFNAKLLEVIAKCKDFILVLPENGLDRCSNEDDWVRIEIECAIESRVNIIPVMLRGFTFPKVLPESIKEIRNYNGIPATDHNFTDASLAKLVGFLKSRRGFTLQRYKLQFIVLIALLVVTCGIFGYIYWQQRRIFVATCIEQTKIMSGGIAAINMNLNIAKDAYGEWNKFFIKFSYASPRDTARIRHDFLKFIEFKRNSIEDRHGIQRLSEQSYNIMRKGGITPEEINAFYELAVPKYAVEVGSYLTSLSNYAKLPVIFPSINQYAQKLYLGTEYSAKTTYYTLLALFSTMPKGCETEFLKIHPQLNNFNEITLGGTFENYEALADAAMKNWELIVSEMSGVLNEDERVVESMQYNLDKTKEEMGRAIIDERLSGLNQKKVDVEKRKAELTEADKRLSEAYERALVKSAIKADDDQWTQWGKMLRIGTLANNALISRTQAKRDYDEQVRIAKNQGLDPSFIAPYNYTISVDEMFSNVDKWLVNYLKNFPSGSIYVVSARQYYKALRAGKVPYLGVLVIGTQNDESHPVLKVGDIVIERKGQRIRNSDHYGSLANDPAVNKVKILRFAENGTPQYITETIPADCKVLVGMLDLTENE